MNFTTNPARPMNPLPARRPHLSDLIVTVDDDFDTDDFTVDGDDFDYGWEDEQYGFEDYEPNPYDGTYSED